MGDSAAVIGTIIKILSTPFVIDAILIIFLIVSFMIGLRRKGWRSLWRFIFVAILLLCLGLFALKPIANWLASEKFFNTINFYPVFDYGGSEPIVITSITQLIYVLGRLSTNREQFTLAYSSELAFGLCRAISLFVIVLFVQLFSWIISAALWPLVRKIVPKSIRFKKPLKFLGALLGLLQGVIYVACYMTSMGALAPGFAYLYESGQASLFGIDNSLAGIVSVFNPNNSSLFGGLSLEDLVFKFNIEGSEETYYVSSEFVSFSEALMSSELDEETIADIIEQFEDECFSGGDFICSV